MTIKYKRLAISKTPAALRRILKPTLALHYGERSLLIGCENGASERLMWWEGDWKTQVIAQFAGTGTFFDVGVNVGQTLVDYKLTHPAGCYIGFEPNPLCVAYVSELIRSNSLHGSRVVPVGLSDRAGVLPLYTHKGKSFDGSASTKSDVRPSDELDVQYIPCFALDDIYDSVGVPVAPTFIKIDVEGAELEALKGMVGLLGEHRPMILCEVLNVHPSADRERAHERNSEMMTLLRGADYIVRRVLKSDDDRQMIGTQEVEEFSSEYWNEESIKLCDYLFVPAERVSELAAI